MSWPRPARRSVKADLATARNTLTSANIGLLAAKTELSDAETAGVLARTRQAKIGLANATNQVTSARRDVTAIQTKLRHASLVAPVAGIVTEVNVGAGRRRPDGRRDHRRRLDPSRSRRTSWSATSPTSRVGQKATVTITALDQQVQRHGQRDLAGRQHRSAAPRRRLLPGDVELTERPANARSGMSADVTVTTASATGVITVPSAALRGNAGNYSVLTLAPTAARPRPPSRWGS